MAVPIVVLLYLAFACTLGWWCADYLVWAISGQDIHFAGDLVLSLVGGSIIVPGALLFWVASLFGVIYPLMAAGG